MFRDDFLCAKFFDQWAALSRQSQVLRQDLYQLNAKNNAGLRDGVDKWENQNRNNAAANTK